MAAAAKPMTLQDRILQIDHIQARRFSKLNGEPLDIASEGISQTFEGLRSNGCQPGCIRRQRNYRRRA